MDLAEEEDDDMGHVLRGNLVILVGIVREREAMGERRKKKANGEAGSV